MAWPVRWSGRARADLRLAVAYVTQDSPDAGGRLGSALIGAVKSLAEFAERGRVVPELGDPAVREILLGRYRIVYEVFPDRIGVARIIHGSRDFLGAWGRDGGRV